MKHPLLAARTLWRSGLVLGFLAALAALTLWSSEPCWAQVSFNNANTITNTQGTSFSFAASVTAGGSNLCAIAIVAFDHQASGSVSAPTYGGNTMTSAGAAVFNSTSDAGVQLFWLVNPPTGSNTLAGSGTNISETYVNLVSFKGCDQTNPVRASTYTTAIGLSTNPQLVITSNSSDLTITGVDSGAPAISGTNQTSDGINNAGSYAAASDHATTGAASVTHTWTQGSGNWAIAGFSIKAAAGGGPTCVPRLMLTHAGGPC